MTGPNSLTKRTGSHHAAPSTDVGSTTSAAASSSSLAGRLSGRRLTFAFYLVHANMVFYAFFWWLNQPVLPYLSRSLGANNQMFGYFSSAQQFVQLCGAPLIGRVIDVRGAKLALLVSHAAAALSYGLLWQATSVPLLFASQLPTVAMAAMHSSQAYITLVTDTDDRARQLGRVSLSYGIGFVLGPIVGGTLTKYIALSSIAAIAAVGSAGVMIALWLCLPDIQPAGGTPATGGGSAIATVAAAAADESNDASAATTMATVSESATRIESDAAAATIAHSPSPKKTTGVASSSSITPASSHWYSALSLLSLPSIRTLILVKFLVATALAVYRTCFSLVSTDHFGLDAQQNGFILSGVGGLTMVCNIFLVGAVTDRYHERVIVERCIALVGVCLALSACVGVSLPALLASLIPMTVGGAMSATILTSILTQSSSAAQAGSVLGLDMAIGTAARVLAPTLGGWLLLAGYETVGGVAALLTAAAFVLAHGSPVEWGQMRKKATPPPAATSAASHAPKKEEAEPSHALQPMLSTKKDL